MAMIEVFMGSSKQYTDESRAELKNAAAYFATGRV